jgi:hypothetical protein
MWWMPWVFMLMKEVLGCRKPREAAKKRYYSGISEWGNPVRSNSRLSTTENLQFTVDHR